MWIREAQQSDEAEIVRLREESGRHCHGHRGQAPSVCPGGGAACWVLEHHGRLRAAVRAVPVRHAHELQALVAGTPAGRSPVVPALVALPALHLMDLVCERSVDSGHWASMLHLHCLEQAMAGGMASLTGSQACGSFAGETGASSGMGLQRLKVLGYCFQPVERDGQGRDPYAPSAMNWLGTLPHTRFEQTRRALRLRHSPPRLATRPTLREHHLN